MNLKLVRYISSKFAASARRQKFLSFSRMVALFSVMLGSMALIVSLSVLTGFENALRENAVKFTSHIQIIAFNRKPLTDYGKTIQQVREKFSEVTAIAPVIEKEGLIRSKSYIEGIMIRGVNPDVDINNLKKYTTAGTYKFSTGPVKEIIIGKRLAKKLGVKLNEELVVYAMREGIEGTMSYPDISKFKVTGIYETGMAKYDDIVAYIPFETASYMFKMPGNSATGYEIILKDVSKAGPLSEQIQSYLGYPHYCISIFDLHNAMFAWIELQKEPIPLVLGLISIVAVFNILTILLITVVEKTHSIGILRALGLTNKEIIAIFVYQGTSIGFIGTLLGCAIALIFSIVQQQYGLIHLPGEIYFMDKLPVAINPIHYVIVIGISICLSLAATLIPSFIAVKINTIKALRFK